jgi:hypothetical protein
MDVSRQLSFLSAPWTELSCSPMIQEVVVVVHAAAVPGVGVRDETSWSKEKSYFCFRRGRGEGGRELSRTHCDENAGNVHTIL